MDTSWFELRVNYQKVAAFSYGDSGQTREEAKGKTFALLEVTRGDLYRNKVMQVVEVWKSHFEKGLFEKLTHEELPLTNNLTRVIL